MHRNASLFAAAALCAAFSTACNKEADKAEPAAEAPTAEKTAEPTAEAAAAPEFEIEAERVVVTETLAPNATYAEQGLGLKAEEGQTFVCAFYSVTNAGKAPAYAQSPMLVAADGSKYEVSVEAAGKLPSEWESSFANAKIEPGASQAGPHCFQVPAAVAEGALKLHFVDEGNMSGEGAWEKTVELPAAGAEGAEGAEGAAAEGEGAEGAAAEGDKAEGAAAKGAEGEAAKAAAGE